MVKNLTIIALFALVFTGCGLHVSSDPVKVEGNVTHTIVIDPTDLEAVLSTYCKSKYTQESDVDSCVSEQLALFWNALNFSAPPGSVAPAPSPSPTPSSGG